MEKLIEKLQNPFKGLTNKDINGIQDRCRDIAEDLFENYCIKCDNKTFRFAEIEFYYYEKGKWEEDWNKVTYARDGYVAGELFYHLSGIDICFESNYNNANAKFGGILIRAIKDTRNKIIAGPLTCKDEILNTCKGKQMPILAPASMKQNIVIRETYRALGKEAIDRKIDKPYNLCFYDVSKDNDWNPYTDKYDKKKGIISPIKGTYKTDRFNENH